MEPNNRQYVCLTSVNMPFGKMVVLFINVMFAWVFATILVGVILLIPVLIVAAALNMGH